MKKKIPTFTSDREAEAFVGKADLSDYDLSGAQLVRFEFKPKGRSIQTDAEKRHQAGQGTCGPVGLRGETTMGKRIKTDDPQSSMRATLAMEQLKMPLMIYAILGKNCGLEMK